MRDTNMYLASNPRYCASHSVRGLMDKSFRRKPKNLGRPLVSDGGAKLLATAALNS